MSTDEADAVFGRLLAAFPNWNPPAVTQQLYLDHLTPLPVERATAGVDDLLTRSTFPPALGELVLACGVDSQDGRDALKRAIAGRWQLLRDFRAPCGWRVEGEEIAQPPMPMRVQARTIGEVLRAGGLPDAPHRRALDGPPPAALVPLRELAPSTELPAWVEPMRAKAQDSIDALDHERARLRLAVERTEAEARAFAHLRADLEADLTSGEVPGTLLATVAEKLLRRLAGDPEQGCAAAVEVLAKACWPGLEVKELRFFPDDEQPATVRLVLKRSA